MRFNNNVPVNTYNGGVAYNLSANQELIKMCLTSFIKNDFYENYSEKIQRVQEYCTKTNIDFLKNLSIWSREYGLRTINHIIFVEGILKLRGKKEIRNFVNLWILELVKRPDELIDILGYFAYRDKQNLNSIKIPNVLKEAIKTRLERFSDYQISKYKGNGDLNLFDLINITHAKSESIDKLMKGTLKSADTWEVEISAKGNNKETWERLMNEDKLGALATIRNLRNMSKVGVDFKEYLTKIDFKKIFPFQAIQALDILDTEGFLDNDIYNIIMSKVKESFEFIAKNYTGKVAIGIDYSGSMFGEKVSNLSKIDRAKMATYYGLLLGELIENSDVYIWGSDCMKIDKNAPINELININPNWGTYVHTFTNKISNQGYDYAIILTDEQISDSCKNVVNKQTIIWGLHDYSNTIANNNGVVYFTGYNDIMWKISKDINNLSDLEKEIIKL